MSQRPDREQVLDWVAEAAGRFNPGSHPEDVLVWAAEKVGVRRLAVATSFADTVLTHLAARALPGVDVLFVDTGYHFVETIGLRDAVADVYDVTLRTLAPVASVAEQDAAEGPELYARNPDKCCALRKVAPFSAALQEYSAWASGLRRDDHNSRADVELVTLDPRRDLLKINPLAHWTQEQVDAYTEEQSLLVNPLVELGYRSVGCAPCTAPVAEGADPRSGRWAGFGKLECGMHS
ncbi:MAG: phosphoadenylyl-sulfate reductase [Actinobacteria bacterium]|nr:phosphoadenylyl-sulfate reductase [Actinomycetota bacterium]